MPTDHESADEFVDCSEGGADDDVFELLDRILVDLVKSRYMNQPFDMVTGHGRLYSGVGDCLRKTIAAEGLRGLYKGWLPNWLRIGPHTVITFLCFETMRKAAGIAPV